MNDNNNVCKSVVEAPPEGTLPEGTVCFTCNSQGVASIHGCPECKKKGTCRIQYFPTLGESLRKCPAMPGMPMFNKFHPAKNCPYCKGHQHVILVHRIWLSAKDFCDTTRPLSRQERRAALKKPAKVTDHQIQRALNGGPLPEGVSVVEDKR